jgi:hypothetical protein
MHPDHRIATDAGMAEGIHRRIRHYEAMNHLTGEAEPLTSQVQRLIDLRDDFALDRNRLPVKVKVFVGVGDLVLVLRQVLEVGRPEAAGFQTLADLSEGICDAGHRDALRPHRNGSRKDS